MVLRSTPLELDWLPVCADFEAGLANAKEDRSQAWNALRALANHRLDFLQTGRVARALDAATPPESAPALRLVLAGSFTVDHLIPGLCLGALRRGLALEVYTPPYGQWRQQLIDATSAMHAQGADAFLICADEAEVLPQVPIEGSRALVHEAVEAKVAELVQLWRTIRERLGAVVIQQLPIRSASPLFGHYERLVPASPDAIYAEFEYQLVKAAADEGTLILDPMAAARNEGVDALQDRLLWLHAKQHVSPAAAPWFGDQAARILASLRGLVRKVLVLDLDNTLWGGVLGDDGIDGIVMGEGSARGEAFKAFQLYAKALRSRGILLAVSSKNDPQRADAAFDHPEMMLRRSDFGAFVADWSDKATGLQRIAQELSLGLESLVFFDDNPVERALVRRSLPEVAVPEAPEAPEDYVRCLVAAGYFEAVAYTADDAKRAQQYAENAERRRLEIVAPDMDSFLRGLEMKMQVGPVERVDLVRVTQLINKTNQFNLTTKRYTQADVEGMMRDPDVLTFCVRLQDRFGDNGIICVVIGRMVHHATGASQFEIDTWLMSCRVLGRRVEEAVSSVIAAAARAAGARAVVGSYRPTAKNEMVADLFPRLGYAPNGKDVSGISTWKLDLGAAPPPPPNIQLVAEPRLLESLTWRRRKYGANITG